ncbi:MAG TPA: copper chaperone PCu(A)C [Phototrophicaceae bacterium]|jgi:copper(I)-binding protein|nr:copper chaperone PCu(A)C [Phototrophicaceae bacterium]
MGRIFVYTAVILFLCAGGPGHAEDVTLGAIKISAPWARATPKGAPVGGGYMTITNTGKMPDRLIAGASPLSSRFEIHEMSMDNGVMKMRPVAGGVEIAAGATVKFEPSGYHLMFVGLKAPFVRGEHVTATLQFEKAGKVNVSFIVEGMGAQTGESSMPHGMQHKP